MCSIICLTEHYSVYSVGVTVVPVVGDADEAPAVVAGVPVPKGGDEAELLRQPLVECSPKKSMEKYKRS